MANRAGTSGYASELVAHSSPYGGVLGGGSGGSSGGGGGSSGGGGGSSSGGSSGSSGGSTSAAPATQTWASLDSHTKAVYTAQLSDIYMQILGRKATQSEVQRWWTQGMSSYAIQQQLMMSKEFRHTALYRQSARKLNMELQQQFGGAINVKPHLMQTWIAHGYGPEDVQAWLWRHPHIFRQSNIYKDRLAQLADVYSQTLGVDWAAQDMRMQRPAPKGKGPGAFQGSRTDQLKNPNGLHPIPLNKNGKPHGPVMVPTPLARHFDQMAFHFKDPEAYRLALMKTPEYRKLVLERTGSVSPQGAPTDELGRPRVGPGQVQARAQDFGA